MKKEDGAERLEAQSERQARAVDVEAASDANAAAWDALRAKVRAFNEKHQLGDFADKSRKSIEQIEREKAQTALDTEDDTDTAEAREEREQAEAEAQKSNEEDRKDAQAKDEAEVVRDVQFTIPPGSLSILQQLPGFEDFNPFIEVLQMLRCGFGLKDAPRLWNKVLCRVLYDICFRPLTCQSRRIRYRASR